MRIALAESYDDRVKDSLFEILRICDKEFFPPLSDRTGTMQTDFANQSEAAGLDAYFTEILKQRAILAEDDGGKIIGFLSFRLNPDTPILTPYFPIAHITTICVSPAGRGQGIGRSFYDFLFRWCEQNGVRYISTRTWSANAGHIPLLRKLGFAAIHTIADDRGKGVDTLYFLKELEGRIA
ncbi:MAG: GNAT family N-acetyltransferase [Candidatus Omnitrophota bacterium]